MIYDVVIIGAGVTGSFTARELAKYKLDICMIDKGPDVACGASGANSGIIHAGYDTIPGLVKSSYDTAGNAMFEHIAKELDIKFKRTGSFVLAYDTNQIRIIQKLYENGIAKGIKGLELLSGEQTKIIMPALSDEVKMLLHAPSAGIVSPYDLTLGAAENAVSNGVRLLLDCTLLSIAYDSFFILRTTKGIIKSRYLVNAAGVHSGTVSEMAGDCSFSVYPRKGEYLLLDKEQGQLTSKVLFNTPGKKGKGVLVAPTVDGNLLLGPTAVDITDKDEISTTKAGIGMIIKSAMHNLPSVDIRYVITSFSGSRAISSRNDFIIERSYLCPRLINLAGIDSPGLTSAPLIAKKAVELLEDAGIVLKEKKTFDPYRMSIKRFVDMTKKEQAVAFDNDHSYGRMICRCENVTEAEIRASVRSVIGARSLDAVKRRTRAGMGRCQGGFCSPRIIHILSQELGIPPEEVNKSAEGSYILTGRTRS